jgi:hypothetical protein
VKLHPTFKTTLNPICSVITHFITDLLTEFDIFIMSRLSTGTIVFGALLVCLALVGGVDAFGAGNIASTARIEGTNWRHGDIEDTLLQLFITRIGGGRKFSKMDVKRVYFGNWLRDYSQAVDVGTRPLL